MKGDVTDECHGSGWATTGRFGSDCFATALVVFVRVKSKLCCSRTTSSTGTCCLSCRVAVCVVVRSGWKCQTWTCRLVQAHAELFGTSRACCCWAANSRNVECAALKCVALKDNGCTTYSVSRYVKLGRFINIWARWVKNTVCVTKGNLGCCGCACSVGRAWTTSVNTERKTFLNLRGNLNLVKRCLTQHHQHQHRYPECHLCNL